MLPKDAKFRSSVFFILQSDFSKVMCTYVQRFFDEALHKRALKLSLTVQNLTFFMQKEKLKIMLNVHKYLNDGISSSPRIILI